MKNQELAKILSEISIFLEMEGVEFKPRAYEKAAHSIEALEEDVADVYRKGGRKALEEIPGVGASIAEKIEEYINTGRIKEHEKLKKRTPVDIEGLTAVEGVGPKMTKTLYQKLKIRNVGDLEKAAKLGKIRRLEHFGEKTEQNILRGIEFLKKSGGRFILGFVLPEIRQMAAMLEKLPEVEKLEIAGSIRRRKETVGDADILAVSSKPGKVMDYFVNLPPVMSVYAKGETKSAVKLKNGMDCDLRVVPAESFGAALQYFTGNKDHNIRLRIMAEKRGWKLNEYGIYKKIQNSKFKIQNENSKFKIDKNKKWVQIAGKTEEEIYKILGLDYIEPEMRENWGELELARKHQLPEIIGYGDLQGDLQIQTDWTDGQNSIEEMAAEAKKLGLKYIAITDHTKTLAMTGGSDEKKLARQMAEIDKINKKISGVKILKGAEVNILKDGSLDINDETLAKLDVCGAAVHSHFNMPKEEMTRRICRAMENPHVDIIFHPTGRVIQKREAYELDMDKIIKCAKKTGTVLEVDAYPDRLDLKDEHIKKAVEAGVKLAIDSDAHDVNHIHFLEHGIAQARRGWAKKSDVVNAWPLPKMKNMLK